MAVPCARVFSELSLPSHRYPISSQPRAQHRRTSVLDRLGDQRTMPLDAMRLCGTSRIRSGDPTAMGHGSLARDCEVEQGRAAEP